jgi:hypothetical protein
MKMQVYMKVSKGYVVKVRADISLYLKELCSVSWEYGEI